MKKFLIMAAVALCVGFVACEEDENIPVIQPGENLTSKGVFLLNEGNMGDGTGSLFFINSNDELQDSVYYYANNKELLGNVAQDMFIANGKMYIICQNGERNGGKGMLIIADAKTFKQEKVYSKEELNALIAPSTLSMPSNLAVVGNDIYIRDNNGVYMLSDGKMTLVTNSKGIAKKRMVAIGDKVYAMNGKKICVIKKGKIAVEITANGTLSGLAKSYDGNLWASCITPNQIMKISTTDYTTVTTHDLTENIGAGQGVAPAFSAVKDTLYFSNAGFKLNRHIFNEDKTEFVADIKELLPDAGIYYNSLGVDPVTGKVYFATLKGYSEYKTVNDIAIFDFSKTPALQQDFKNKNSFPAGIYFVSNFE